MNHSLSREGLNLIKHFEGFSAKVYDDVIGKKTIGYGHLVLENEDLTEITEEQAVELLSQDTQKAVKCVNSLVRCPLAQNEFDALVSFVYNLGCGNFQNSTLLRYLNRGEMDDAAEEFLKWNRAEGQVVKGLVNRRIAEREVFINGIYPK